MTQPERTRKLARWVARAVILGTVLVGGHLAAQDNSEAMRVMIAQMRQTAASMKGQLPQSDIDEMLRSADELEHANRQGAFKAPEPVENPDDIITHMTRHHGSRFEWLIRETACAGYQWETWRVYNVKTGDRDDQRNVLCKRAYALFEQYFYLGRDGNRAQAMEKLSAFDKAAHAAVDFYERR